MADKSEKPACPVMPYLQPAADRPFHQGRSCLRPWRRGGSRCDGAARRSSNHQVTLCCGWDPRSRAAGGNNQKRYRM